MALSIKIHGETPKSGKAICHSCKHASVVIGQNCEERIICGEYGLWNPHGPGIVRFRVASCGAYHPTNQAWLHEMKEMAWKIEARKRGPAGFGEAVKDESMEVIITPPSKDSNVPD